MDYEKKYKEALERAKVIYQGSYKPDTAATIAETLQNVFPELCKSENERIRKELIEYIKDQQSSFISAPDCRDKYEEEENNKYNSWLAWLEKQGEQKPFDYENANIQQNDFAPKVEPKFKVGNWYQCTKDFFGKGVTFDKNTAYYCAKEGCLQCEYGCHIAIVKNLYDNFKLWTIQDAEDGDVLAFDNNTIVIFKDLYNATTFHSYCHIEDGLFGVSKDEMPDWWEGKGFHPATKEQREVLFQKMKEVGYEWDAEKKELKKIEQKPAVFSEKKPKHMISAEAKEAMYDKPACVWSEEDEKMCQETIDWFEKKCFPYALENDNPARESIKWLKSLKDRVQPKQEWTEEDKRILDALNNFFT